jgi:hypothetical protein
VTPARVEAVPFAVRIKLDDSNVARSLPAGRSGYAAIFTDHVKRSHIVRGYCSGRSPYGLAIAWIDRRRLRPHAMPTKEEEGVRVRQEPR